MADLRADGFTCSTAEKFCSFSENKELKRLGSSTRLNFVTFWGQISQISVIIVILITVKVTNKSVFTSVYELKSLGMRLVTDKRFSFGGFTNFEIQRFQISLSISLTITRF